MRSYLDDENCVSLKVLKVWNTDDFAVCQYDQEKAEKKGSEGAHDELENGDDYSNDRILKTAVLAGQHSIRSEVLVNPPCIAAPSSCVDLGGQ